MVEDICQQQVYDSGIVETLRTNGIILPRATKILPWLTHLIAISVAMAKAGALLTHPRRKELIPRGVINIILFSLAVFTATGRFWS